MHKIILTQGDPAGIGAEVIEKAIAFLNAETDFIILGDARCFSSHFLKNCTLNPSHLQAETRNIFIDFPFSPPPILGRSQTSHAETILKILDYAIDLCHQNPQNYAMVTAPLQKETIATIDPTFTGHTDYIRDRLSALDGLSYEAVMMLGCEALKVVPLTVHIPLQEVSPKITPPLLQKTIQIIHDDFKKYYHKSPHIAVAGLNPHAGDGGILGQEEQNILIPTLLELQKKYSLSGPYAADSLFYPKARQTYDIALCMYHDQALIPIKTIAFDEAVNITLGLPIIRTSPDHGTALNIAGMNKASAASMIEAIKTAKQYLSC